MISVSGLTCGYHGKALLRDITFSAPGHLTLLGRNGSGKSTLAKTLCGLLGYRGSILIDGNELRTLAPAEVARQIAYIPSKLESYDTYTDVEDFVMLGRYPYKAPLQDYGETDRAVVAGVLDELGLAELRRAKIHELSSGQQQLVLIAQALAQQSRIIIFDEPTANLDPAHSAAFAKRIGTLQKTHQTLLITHDLHLAHHVGGSVLFIGGGEGRFYEESGLFFEPENLQRCYGVAFDEQSRAVLYG
jgi:iron complex transport system ATP-binding protein